MMFTKPSRSARRLEEAKDKRDLETKEKKNKQEVRRRDKGCRFPRCGCRKLKWPTEVSHQLHKGMGGNPAGDRSTVDRMIELCKHRHQEGAVSRHRGTLRIRELTPENCNGPVAFDVDLSVVNGYAALDPLWFEVARELKPGTLETLTVRQTAVLSKLSTMSL